MLRRELLIVFRARITWIVIVLTTLLTGHGFLLAFDIYSSASTSTAESVLMRREMDPLVGIVRPALGGFQLASALLLPLIAARGLSLEKERGSYPSLVLQTGSATAVLWAKFCAALFGALLSLLAPVSMVVLFVGFGGHIDLIETATALMGHLLYVLLIVSVTMAASAWTENAATAIAIGVLFSISSWAVDAARGYASLTWLLAIVPWSISTALAPFERGVLSLSSLFSFVVLIVGTLALASIGVGMGKTPKTRGWQALLVLLVTFSGWIGAARTHRSFDWTEERRASLPLGAVQALREIREPIAMDVWLDAEDSRRRQLESDTLAKLSLARGDIQIRMPLDGQSEHSPTQREDRYGVLAIHVGERSSETRSTSRREIVALIFELAKKPFPDWTQPSYPGYPVNVTEPRRTLLSLLVYLVLPLAWLTLGIWFTRIPRRRSS